jgi:hypothetical protein
MTYRVVMARRLDASQPVSSTEIKQRSISLKGVHCEQRNAVFGYFLCTPKRRLNWEVMLS